MIPGFRSRPRVMAVLAKKMPSTMIGIVKPLEVLRNQGQINLRVFTENHVKPWHLNWPDVVVFGRNTEPLFDFVLEGILLNQIPTIFELDDNLWEVPQQLELGKYHRAPERIHQLEKYIACADLVRVYNPHIYARVEKLNPNVKMVKAGVDFRLLPPWPGIYRKPGKIRIAYPTSRIEDDLYSVFIHAVKNILDQYSHQVEFHLWGSIPAELQGLPAVKAHPKILDYNRFLRRFSRMGFEIGLAPLVDNPFSVSKTNNKFREYGASGVAGVYSNIGPYVDSVEDGVTGLLVRNTQEAWQDAIEKLILNPTLRQQIQVNARQVVERDYNQKEVVQTWREDLRTVLGKTKTEWNAKMEIPLRLEQNVWSGLRFHSRLPVYGVLKLEIQTRQHGRPLRAPINQFFSDTKEVEFRFTAVQDAVYKARDIVVTLSGKKSILDLMDWEQTEAVYGEFFEEVTIEETKEETNGEEA
ncbi:glycosyltransferase [Ornatilinea apprima]|nr:glycosyltransferase [Ornatilinea apprima]